MVVVKVDGIGVMSLIIELDVSDLSNFLLSDTDGTSSAREYLLQLLSNGYFEDRPEWNIEQIKKEMLISIPSLNLDYILQVEQHQSSGIGNQGHDDFTQQDQQDDDVQQDSNYNCQQEHQKKSNVKWTYKSVLKLIDLWKERKERFENNIEKNEAIWEDLAAAMVQEGLNFTYLQCENKFKYLKKKYIQTKDFNQKSTGQPEKSCPFYEELEDIFKKSPLVCPPCLVSSRDGIPSTLEETLNVATESEPALSAVEDIQPPPKKTRLESSLSKWAENFQEQAAQRETARQKRHEEMIQVQRESNDIFKMIMTKLLDKL